MRSTRILLIEDSSTDIFLVQEALIEHGVEADVSVAEDGAVARRIIENENESPNLVVLDLNLPQVNGLTLLAIMRDRGWCSRVPVVVLTSSESKRERDQALAMGARRVLHKASNFEEFLKIGSVFRELLTESAAGAPSAT